MTTDRPANPWQRFRRKVRDEGPLYAALLMLNHVVPQSLLDVGVWVVSSADLSTFIDAEDPDDDVRWQGSVDAGGLTIPDRKQPDFENLLECGKLAAVIERDGGIVAWDLFATERFIQKKWLWFAFGDRDIYSSWSFVEPEYRGQGLAVQLALFAYREFARRGYLRDYSVTGALNRSALKTSVKVRHWPIGRIAYGRCCGFTVIRFGRRIRAGFWSADKPLVIDFRDFLET